METELTNAADSDADQWDDVEKNTQHEKRDDSHHTMMIGKDNRSEDRSSLSLGQVWGAPAVKIKIAD